MEVKRTDIESPNVSTDLQGEVALVTGATSGLGKRFAEVLALSGAKVAVTGRREDRLEATFADQINQQGGEAFPVKLDMTDADSMSPPWNRRKRRLVQSQF